jgi:hypothetical protein
MDDRDVFRPGMVENLRRSVQVPDDMVVDEELEAIADSDHVVFASASGDPRIFSVCSGPDGTGDGENEKRILHV